MRLAVAFVCAVLAAAPQGTVAEINGVRIHYEIAGAGEPLVLIHGWSLNLRMWEPQVREFGREYRVIRIDRRGFGESTGAEDVTWDADDLRQLLDVLGVERAHVLGMSQGARVALAFAVRFPQRVNRLILHGSPPPDGFGLTITGSDRLNQAEFEAIAKTDGIEAARRAWAKHPLMEVPAGNVSARKAVDQLIASYRGGRWLNPTAASGPIPAPSMADLASVKASTLVIVGDREIPYLRITADALTYAIPGARKVEISGGGHMINLIEPARYNGAVLDFLRDRESRRHR